MDLRALGRYGLLYAALYVALSVAIMAFLMVFPELQGSHFGVAVIMGAASFTYIRFLKDHKRLPKPSEYWTLVLISTAISTAMDSTLLIIIIYTSKEYPLGLSEVAIIIVIALILGIIWNMPLYSSYVGKSYLKRIDKKQKT